MISTACILWFARGHELSPCELERLAKHGFVWLLGWTESCTDGVYDPSWSLEIAEQIRAINPAVKIGLYSHGLPLIHDMDPAYDWFADADLYHALGDGHPLKGTVAQGAATQAKMVNFLNEARRGRAADLWRDFATEHGLNGLLYDGCSADLLADVASHALGAPDGCISTYPGYPSFLMQSPYWQRNALVALADRVRRRLAQAGVEMLTVGDVAPEIPRLDEQIAYAITSPSAFAAAIARTRAATDQRQAVMLYALPGLFRLADPTTAWLPSETLARFYLAFYLLIDEAGYTRYGYSDVLPYRGWSEWSLSPTETTSPYVTWLPEFERDYGYPLGGCVGNDSLWWRKYSNGVALCNPSDVPYIVPPQPFAYRAWHPTDGPVVDLRAGPFTIPPKTGWFLFLDPAVNPAWA